MILYGVAGTATGMQMFQGNESTKCEASRFISVYFLSGSNILLFVMKKKLFKKITALLLFSIITFSTAFESRAAAFSSNEWDPFTATAINDLIAHYNPGINGGTPYVILDFDNTVTIFNVQEQLAIYQLQTMAFAITPEELPVLLRANLPDPDRDVSAYGLGNGTYNDWILDISDAYTKLYVKYGPFTPMGLPSNTQHHIRTDELWQEFSTKMRCLYWLIYSAETANIVYPWIDSWYVGMTQQEVYDLAFRSHNNYRSVKTEQVTWTSPATIESRVGQASFTWTMGISVPKAMEVLFQSLRKSGFDVWLISESHIDVIRAAVDVFGLHDYINGVIAMTHTLEEGKYIQKYDYLTGYPARAISGQGWENADHPTRSTTQGAGKLTAINNTLYRMYGHGPIAGFMDSTGDFDFCTQYNTMKLVVCFNRGKNVDDGGGLISELAIYQKEILGYDLITANAKADTLYCLQGRDENGYRSLRNSQDTILRGTREPVLLAHDENFVQLAYFIDHQMSTRDICNTFVFRTPAEKSELGFGYGFMINYHGYHSIR